MALFSQILGDETIAALATGPASSHGAIALIRVSGARAHEIVAAHVSPWPLVPRVQTLCAIRDDTGRLVDRALVTRFDAPASFTGEPMVEIATHGGVVVPTLVLSALLSSGVRQALPGEFTRRAVLNGKMDVLQAEATGDLIGAQSRAMHAAALRQLDGGLTRRIMALRDDIIMVEALIAYDIDFPEEDDGPIDASRVEGGITTVIAALDGLLATAPIGELIREGAVVVIAGPPNAGKSSLFNAILGTERAIVTDVPGTTRDAIEAVIDTGQWPIRLVDTAGLRDTSDVVERIGIEVSMRYLANADVVLACGETMDDIVQTVNTIGTKTHASVIGVRTKVDHAPDVREVPSQGSFAFPVATVSAVTGTGIRALVGDIERVIAERHGATTPDAPILTRERHRHAIRAARDEMSAFADAWRAHALPMPVAAVHLRAASHALEEVVGTIELDDVLDRLFQTFCVGK